MVVGICFNVLLCVFDTTIEDQVAGVEARGPIKPIDLKLALVAVTTI